MDVGANTKRGRTPSSRRYSADRSSRPSLADPQTSLRRQEALIQAGLVLASELSLPAVLQKITELACEVADARYGTLGVLGQDGRLRDFITSGITERERRAIGKLPVGNGILGVLITQAHPLRLQRIQDDPRSVGFPHHHPPMTSFLGVPISVRGNLYGNLYLTEKRGAPAFTAEDERAVVTLAAQAGVAIENARLFAEAQQRLAMEARHRLARELHDSISQALFSMNLETRAAQLALEQDVTDPSGDMAGRLARLRELTDNALAETRALIFELRPEALREEGLAGAIRKHADAVGARADLAIDVETPEPWIPLPPDAEEQLYRTAQEALANVIKHANASHARIRLFRTAATPPSVRLEISDDGTGFDSARSRPGHLGLTTMQQRVEGLGGSLEVRSTPGSGTRVQALVPLPAATRPDSTRSKARR